MACLFVLVTSVFLTASCVKEEYDFDKLSTRARINPTLIAPVVYGNLTLENALEEKEDTLVFNEDGTIKLIYGEDSVFSFDVSDVVDIPDPSPETQLVEVGPLMIEDFSHDGFLTLGVMAAGMAPPEGPEIISKDGTNDTFPVVPVQDIGTFSIPAFSHFTYMTINEGTVSMTLTNNWPVEVSLTIGLKNQSDNSPVGADFVFNGIAPGASQTQTVDMAGVYISNTLDFDIRDFSSPGSTSNIVPIDLGDRILISLISNDIKASSGLAVIPDQVFYSDTDMVDLDPDPGIEITYVEVETADLNYSLNSGFSEAVVLDFILPSALDGDDTATYQVPLSANGSVVSTISLAGIEADLSTDPLQPYNQLPFIVNIAVQSSGNQILFDLSDNLSVDHQVQNVEFSYLEGFFGQQTYNVDQDTIEIALEGFYEKISGDLIFTNPMVRFPYVNSLGIPANLDVVALGENTTGDSQALNATPQPIVSMEDRDGPVSEGAVQFDRTNSDIVEVIRIRPHRIIYSGEVLINPGGHTGTRDNFVFGDSQITGGVELELPWNIQVSNLTLRDTVENPLFIDSENDFTLSDLEFVRMYFYSANGFPLDAEVILIPYDMIGDIEKDGIVVPELISAAPVDASGRVTGPSETTITIELTEQNLIDLEQSEDMIILFRFNSTDDGSREVVIYTDYAIDFRLSVETEIDYEFDFEN
jgi:hypothetical protein